MPRSKKKTQYKKVVELNRKQIGSIDLEDLKSEEELSDSEKLIYLQQAESIFVNPVFRNEIKKIIRMQMFFISCYSENRIQDLIGRGTINGITLLEDRVKELHNKYKDLTKKEDDDFDHHKVVSEL